MKTRMNRIGLAVWLFVAVSLLAGCEVKEIEPQVVKGPKVGDIYTSANPGTSNPFKVAEPFVMIYTITAISNNYAMCEIWYVDAKGKSFGGKAAQPLDMVASDKKLIERKD